jgi:hypothetical protein
MHGRGSMEAGSRVGCIGDSRRRPLRLASCSSRGLRRADPNER